MIEVLGALLVLATLLYAFWPEPDPHEDMAAMQERLAALNSRPHGHVHRRW